MLTEMYIRNNKDNINFMSLEYGTGTYPVFSLGFYRDFSDKLNWWKISKNNILSRSFLTEFVKYIKWDEYFQNNAIVSFDILKKLFDSIPKKYINYFVSNKSFTEDQLDVVLKYSDVDYLVDAFLMSDVSEQFLNNYISKIPKSSNKRDSYTYKEKYAKFIKKYNGG